MSYFHAQTERDVAYNVLMQDLSLQVAREMREIERQKMEQLRRIKNLEKRYYRESGSEAEKARREEVQQERYRRADSNQLD